MLYWPEIGYSNLVCVVAYHWSFVLYDVIFISTIKSFNRFCFCLGLMDKKSNFFTHFCGVFLRPKGFLDNLDADQALPNGHK